jgi:hypothetical protein
MIDFAATSGVAGDAAGGLAAACPTDEAVAGPCSRAASATGFSGGVVATGAKTGAEAGAAAGAGLGDGAGGATIAATAAEPVADAGFCAGD